MIKNFYNLIYFIELLIRGKIIHKLFFLSMVLFSYKLDAQWIGRYESVKGYAVPIKMFKAVLNPLPAGIYSVGKDGYFPSIDSAFNKLSLDGIAGEVTLELIDELYTVPADSFGFRLEGPIQGSSPNSRITIKPALDKQIIIQGDQKTVFMFNNVSYMTLDGISLSGQTTLSIHAYDDPQLNLNDCVDFCNNSDHNIIQNVTFITDGLLDYSANVAMYTTSGSNEVPDSNIVQNNIYKKGNTAIWMSAYYAAATARIKGNIIRNNIIGSESDSLLSWGIRVEKSQNAIIENNIIQNLTVNSVSSENLCRGISSYWCNGDIIRNNVVHGIKSRGGSQSVGIVLCGGLKSDQYGNNNIIYNNIVYDIQSASTASNSSVAGIQLWYQNNSKIYYNTVYLTGRGSNILGSASLNIFANCSNIIDENNIFVNLRSEFFYTGSSIDVYTLSVLNSDYNDLYSPHSGSNCTIVIGGASADLGYWQINGGKDFHSFSIMPKFNNDDMHIDRTFTTLIESGGIWVDNILTDIDGDKRNILTPDIGADEFDGIKPRAALLLNPNQIDFGNISVAQSSDTINVVIKNRNLQPVVINSIINTAEEFILLNLPNFPLTLTPNDSFYIKVYFHPMTFGVFNDKILISNNDNFNPNPSISLKGNVSNLGPKFQFFYNKVNEISSAIQKNTIVDSFMNANTVLPFVEDSVAIFIYRGEANSISVVSDANYWIENISPMYRISGTDLWFRAQNFEMDARIDYRFLLDNSNSIVDPKNPRVCPNGFGNNSELAMPEYVDASEIKYYPEILHGSMVDTMYESTVLGNSRNITIYTPPDFNSQGTKTYGLALFNDGGDFINIAKTQNIFDYLIDKKQIQPLIGIFVPPVDRDAEYADIKTVQYESFIINEVMPFIDSKYRTKTDPNQRAMFGISFGGLITTQICYNHPETFGFAGLYSPSYRANGMSVFNSVISGIKKDLEWYIDWGIYESTIVTSSVQLRDALINKGSMLKWNQWNEGHSWGSWRAHLDIALEYFFPGEAVFDEEDTEIPKEFILYQNYPNPFNPSTTFRYSIPNESRVIIKVYDILGKEIETLVNEEKPTGSYEITWNASKLSSGVYFYRLQAGEFISIKKMLVLK